MSVHVGDARSAMQSVSHDGADHQNPPTPMTPGGGDFPERISMGGESLGSYSEFETVSFADESGQKSSRLWCTYIAHQMATLSVTLHL